MNPPIIVQSLKCLGTFLVVTLAWTFFRSAEFLHSISMVKSMLGFHGLDLPHFANLNLPGISSGGMFPSEILRKELIILLPLLALTSWLIPNSQTLLRIDLSNSAKPKPQMPKGPVIFLAGILLFLGLKSSFEIITFDYLYFRF